MNKNDCMQPRYVNRDEPRQYKCITIDKGGEIKMAVFGLVFVTIGIWGTYNIIKYIED